MQDKLYSKRLKKVTPFVFDHRVACVFGDMIKRSVPGYSDIVQMSGVLAEKYVRTGTCVYDLGCSLGTASQAVICAVKDRRFSLIAVDSSAAMIEHVCRALKSSRKIKIELICGQLEQVNIKKASFVMLNFVLQFISRNKRLEILKKIRRGMVKGGALMLSEKIDFNDKKEKEVQRALHEQFKKDRGYSKLEISQKRTALEKVLVPETLRIHESRLKEAGFSKVYVWFRCFNFVSILAVK